MRLGREGAGGCGHAPEGGPFDRKVDWDSVIPGPGARKCPRRFGVLRRPAERSSLRRLVLRPVSSRPSGGRTSRGFPASRSATGRCPPAQDRLACPTAEPGLRGADGRPAVAQRAPPATPDPVSPASAGGLSHPAPARPRASARGRCAFSPRAPRPSRPTPVRLPPGGSSWSEQEVTSVLVPFGPFLIPTPFWPQGSRFPAALGSSS